MLDASALDSLVVKFGAEIERLNEDGQKQLFLDYLEANPDLVSSGKISDLFGQLIRRMFIHRAFEVLIDCQRDRASHYIVIEEMIWKHLILNDGVGGRSIDDIMKYLRKIREEDYFTVMRSIEARIGKLRNAEVFAGLFRATR